MTGFEPVFQDNFCLSPVSILSLTVATHVLIPIQTHFKAFKGTELLLGTIKQVRRHVNPKFEIKLQIQSLQSEAPTTENTFTQRYSLLGKQLKKAAVWSDPKKQKRLEKLLTQLEQLLKD